MRLLAMLRMSCTSLQQGRSRLLGCAQCLMRSREGLRSMRVSGFPQSMKSSTCSELVPSDAGICATFDEGVGAAPLALQDNLAAA